MEAAPQALPGGLRRHTDEPGASISDATCCASQGKRILIDTGIGPAYGPISSLLETPGHLLEKYPRIGVDPADVESVVCTHLHPDHVGRNVVQENDVRRLAFPNARYVMHQADWDVYQTSNARPNSQFCLLTR